MSEQQKMSIAGRDLNYQIRSLDIFKIKYYEKNPRVASLLINLPKITDDEIDKVLWEKDDTHKLKRQIDKDKGLNHPIIVYNDMVLEGNTRLCCYRHLFKEKGDKWRYIPSQIIIDPLSQEEIFRLLCNEHITGKAPWDAYEKAALYYRIHIEEKMDTKKISLYAGECESTVKKRIESYQLMVKNNVEDKEKYSYFDQLVRNSGIADIRINNPEIDKLVIYKIKKGEIREARTIRSIPDIWKDKTARKKAFVDHEVLEDVYDWLKAKAPMTDSPMLRNVDELREQIKACKRAERNAIKGNTRDRYRVEKLTKELLELCVEIDVKINISRKLRKN